MEVIATADLQRHKLLNRQFSSQFVFYVLNIFSQYFGVKISQDLLKYSFHGKECVYCIGMGVVYILDHNVRCISYLGPIKIIENYSPKSHHDLSWMDTDKNAIQGLVRGEIKTKE